MFLRERLQQVVLAFINRLVVSAPKILFIDTSIFDATAYNFEAVSVTAFKQGVEGRSLTLLMPDVTEREIRRHIAEGAASAVKALETAVKHGRLLNKLPNLRFNTASLTSIRFKIERAASDDLVSFLGLFEVRKLSYEGVRLDEIMDWYDRGIAPFSEKKKQEFPDALALASINYFHSKHPEPIAVIALDRDLRGVCDRYPHLLYFSSLVAYSEALNSEDTRVGCVQSLLQIGDLQIREAIKVAFAASGFFLEREWEGDVSDPEIEEYVGINYHVVALGENACNVAFNAEVRFSTHVSYEDYESVYYEDGIAYPRGTVRGIASDDATFSGVARLRMTDDWTAIAGIESVHLDQDSFPVSLAGGRIWRVP